MYCLGSEGNQHKFELGDTLQVTVRRDGSEVAFQSGSSDQGIDITDKTRAMQRASLPANVGLAIQDGIGEEIGIDLAQQSTKLGMMAGKM